MISVINASNVRETFPEIEIILVQQCPENSKSLVRKAANNTLVDIDEVGVLNFGLSSSAMKFNVPCIVTRVEVQNPIIRYNIQYLVSQVELPNLKQTLEHSFPSLQKKMY